MFQEMIKPILIATLSLGLMGLILGIILAFAGKVFAVKSDERVPLITEILPGANCGACGFAGCAAYASAVVKGAKTNACTVGGDKTTVKISQIMGINAEKTNHKRAQVRCSGTKDLSKSKFNYIGIDDCTTASKIGGGDKECPYGCLGLGTCVKKCPFGAIKIEDGIAVVEYEKCTGCGVCVKSCPKGIISLIPFDKKYWVGCMSKDSGNISRKYCAVSCIACGICEKNCPENAITIINNLAKIDYEKCTDCGICAQKCPRKIIWESKIQISGIDTLKKEDISKNNLV